MEPYTARGPPDTHLTGFSYLTHAEQTDVYFKIYLQQVNKSYLELIMELFNEADVKSVMKNHEYDKIIYWRIENYSNQMLGYLGDHHRLCVRATKNGTIKDYNFFVKTMPMSDPWKHKFLEESKFFKKEYVMLSDLFPKFGNNEGENKWRPTDLLLKEHGVFVFEDVVELGYEIRDQTKTMCYEEIITIVEVLAKFAAKSYIYEEKQSIKLNRQYRIWDEYSDYLKEPDNSYDWRNAGIKAVIFILKLFSQYKNKPDFDTKIEVALNELFQKSLGLLNEGSKYRNTVCHRDLWTNNIFFKRLDNGKLHGLIIDFQTVIYNCPLIDLSSFIYFNTNRNFRNLYTNKILKFYYKVLSQELDANDIDIRNILNEKDFQDAYEESSMFSIVQAAILIPMVGMDRESGLKHYGDSKTIERINNVCRNNEILEVANRHNSYKIRIMELFDEIVERYVYPDTEL